MLYVESALEQLRDSLDEAGLKYDIEKLDEKSVNISVVKNNIAIKVWFDVDKQIFGFDMLQGGCKTYSDFKEFENFFGTYLTIYTEFLPSAKAVADEFEKALGINSVYDNFQGNKQTGYIAHFKVLGQDNKVVLISKSPEGFTAKLGVYVDDGTRFKVLTEYKYEVDDVNNVVSIPTIHSYISELSNRYGNDDSIDIERTGVDGFTFNIEGLVINAKIEIMYRDIKYKVSEISGIAVDFECSFDDDPYKLSSLYLICKEKYDDIMYSMEVEAETSSENDTEISDDYEPMDEDEYDSEETEYIDESVVEDNSTDEDDSEYASDEFESDLDEAEYDSYEAEYVDESSDENDDSFDDETGYESDISDESSIEPNYGVDEDVEVDMNFSVKTIIGIDGSISSLQFTTKDDIFIMSVDKAKELGIPIERIDESVSCIKKCGILITEDELARHNFSKDISDNDDMCHVMFNYIFA